MVVITLLRHCPCGFGRKSTIKALSTQGLVLLLRMNGDLMGLKDSLFGACLSTKACQY